MVAGVYLAHDKQKIRDILGRQPVFYFINGMGRNDKSGINKKGFD